MTVAAIGITYNSAKVLPDFLCGLADAASVPTQLIIVDNNSKDDTVAVLEKLAPAAIVIRSPSNDGFAAGINKATKLVAPTDPVLILNPDVRLHPGAIDAMLAAAARPGAGIVVPQLRSMDGSLHLSLRHDPHPLRVLAEAVLGGVRAARLGLGEMIGTPGAYRHARTTDWATGACMLITPACRRRLSLWEESFFLYSEETEFAQRARDAGFAVWYEPMAVATHGGGDAHRSPDLFRLLTVNRYELYRRRHGPLAAAVFRAALVTDLLPRALVGRPTARAALRALLQI